MDRIPYMDLLHPRSHHAVMASEERVDSHVRQRLLRHELQQSKEMSGRAPEQRGQWIVADLLRLFTPSRDAG